MILKLLKPKQSLNKAYLKEKISRNNIELFKTQFTELLDKINAKGDEEHLKSLIADFLKLTWYNNSQHQINPIAKNDLVIHTGKSPNDPFAAILEVKRPGNTSEMISASNANLKAFHELVLYYLDERVSNNRNELKQLIITNIYEWYIIDANEFDKKIYRNTAIKKLYELKKADGKDNPWFYDELKKLLTANEGLSFEATFFDLLDYKKILINTSNKDDKGLIALYKILSPVHLLKLPFANDSNTLQPKFYSELLHLIGLYEYKEGSKKLISRKKDGERNAGSLLENTIVQLDSHDKISRLDKPSQYGDTYQERLYAVALELVITWINRILFLKLLEAQLINYHKGDRSYTFLNTDKIKDFDDLDKLFFRVLAKIPAERTGDIQRLFDKVPYLNSSLFEPTDLEHQTLFINGLEDFVQLPVLRTTVLKDAKSKILKGNLNTLDYLFAFLNAYDFSSEGSEEIQEDNKTLINASVLGLIFEKINGYKDGSFFTPGFITMYMCRETIRRAVVQKFNEAKSWECKNYSEIYDKIADKIEANSIINSLKICDPAVGSGHFLVSALNEILAIKSDLKILLDQDGRTLRDYSITVENDELIITDVDGDIFEYNLKSKESQRIQETLFHEKQIIIENCLFGVDINPNSVKICRLRLWIELLKNAYYKAGGNELETLPNIDINIKVGNSLISRFALDADLKQALKNTKWNINDYKIAVGAYKNATNKAEKRELVTLIESIKTNFRSSISRNSKEYKELSKLRGRLDKLLSTNEDLFGNKKKSKKDLEREQLRLTRSIQKQEEIINEIKNNKIYENAFEWRFEFPEVLDNDGLFVGFDIVIGNPPYGVSINVGLATSESYILFYIQGIDILKTKGQLAFITPDSWAINNNAITLRNKFVSEGMLYIIRDVYKVFQDAPDVWCNILFFNKSVYDGLLQIIRDKPYDQKWFNFITNWLRFKSLKGSKWFININEDFDNIFSKVDKNEKISSFCEINRGYSPTPNEKNLVTTKTQRQVIGGEDFGRYSYKIKPKYLIDTFQKSKDSIKQTLQKPFIGIQRIRTNSLNFESRWLVCQIFNKGYVPIDSISYLTNKSKYHLNYFLAILNSNLINKYYKFHYTDKNVKPLYLNELGFAIPTDDIHLKIVRDVDEILQLKLNNHDTADLEKEIDGLIYDLYNLTAEDIKTIEGTGNL
ncbi:Eco57I restriction-modification methylase domain-containing protein [Mucilaginibacter litoreus]|uniref:site-specific DNA-methyltransferase (adenine-specific) n=1 Tax=Mucilaginibacter litoreus TaxID=1048221 RepID=A0ABW3AUK8_9SPHI